MEYCSVSAKNVLLLHQMWLNGPKFLWEMEGKWPSPPADLNEMPDKHLERRKTAGVNIIATSEEIIVLDKLLEYYSSWYSLQKGVAWLRRFVLFRGTKFKESISEAEVNIKGYLRVKEMQDANSSSASIIFIIIALFIHLKIKKYNGLTFTCLRKYICCRYVFILQIVIR